MRRTVKRYLNLVNLIIINTRNACQMLQYGKDRLKWTIRICFMLSFLGGDGILANNESIRFAEKANLAIRRTAHYLIRANGDSTSRISPVLQSDANTFTIRLDKVFDYGKLPNLLQQSLDQYDITRAYDVVILKCETSEVELGYNFLDLKQKGGVACSTRRQLPGCYNLKITFEPEPKIARSSGWWLVSAGSLLAALGLIIWQRRRAGGSADVLIDNKEANPQKMAFGNSVLDMPNLKLTSAGMVYDLTYREGKLLNLFTNAQNQVLERDFILKSVWEDEGVTVGRSVDVFVSRLRKMLSGDPDIKIAAVHGVGYRLEVRNSI